MVAGMSLGGRQEAESAHTTTARKKGFGVPDGIGDMTRSLEMVET